MNSNLLPRLSHADDLLDRFEFIPRPSLGGECEERNPCLGTLSEDQQRFAPVYRRRQWLTGCPAEESLTPSLLNGGRCRSVMRNVRCMRTETNNVRTSVSGGDDGLAWIASIGRIVLGSKLQYRRLNRFNSVEFENILKVF